MNFIKRGFLGIKRKIGKSLILLTVIFILGNLISGAISIQQATGNVEAKIKERLGAAATIEIDFEKMDSISESEGIAPGIQSLEVGLIKEVGELSYVKYYDYNMTTYLTSNILERYEGDMNEDGMNEEVFGPDDGSAHFELHGINFAPVIEFEEKKGKLVDGRVFTQDEIDNGSSVVIISKKLAEVNNLHVGDTFTLANEIYTHDDQTGESDLFSSRDVVLEVIGLFEPQSARVSKGNSYDGNDKDDYMNAEYQNRIYVSNELVIGEYRYQMEEMLKSDPEYVAMLEEKGEDDSFENYTPMYYLNNHEDMEAFVAEVTPLLPPLYKIVSASDQYESIAGPIESMSKLAKYVLIVAVIATVLITSLVVLLFLRDRKHELGIYLSLGERRSRVVGQILIEVMVVAFIGITISLFSGNLLAGQVSDTLMKADDENGYYDDMIYYDGMIQTDLTIEDVLDSYEVSLNLNYILGFYVIGLLTILISTIVPLIYIVRLNPKKILM